MTITVLLQTAFGGASKLTIAGLPVETAARCTLIGKGERGVIDRLTKR
jgi:hypothetical protein